MMYLKIHQSQRGRIVAVCDEGLVGKVLTDEDVEIDLEMYRGFYVGEKATEQEVKDALKRFDSANLVGKGAVEAALALGLAERRDVMYIKKIPYMQIYRL
ncbi:MAG: DUF424 family protein [Candidatus Micrarchaeota archaeon]